MITKRTELCIEGPIAVPYSVSGPRKIKVIESIDSPRFWKETALLDIQAKTGVYVFAVRAAKGYWPIYVGKATKCFKNDRKTTLPEWSIAGLVRSKGKPSRAAKNFAKMVGMN